ncbi:MAG: hypothetical protein QUS14_13995 [Pyrinomonadaceae bacterium]|nr:hypothetical protein [Pyrinomonadaceae bacterium]
MDELWVLGMKLMAAGRKLKAQKSRRGNIIAGTKDRKAIVNGLPDHTGS